MYLPDFGCEGAHLGDSVIGRFYLPVMQPVIQRCINGTADPRVFVVLLQLIEGVIATLSIQIKNQIMVD